MSQKALTPQQPLVVVAICFILGICVGNYVEIGFAWGLVATLIAVLLFVVSGVRIVGAIAIIGLGSFVAAAHREVGLPPHDESVICLVEVESHNQMSVEAYRGASSDEWHHSSGEFYFWGDSLLDVEVGDRYLANLRFRDWEGRSTAYISASDLLERRPSQIALARRVNDWAYGRLQRMGVDDDVVALSAAMLLGRREVLDRERRTSYVRAGAAHLLAVSGFHLGILIVMVLALFRWLYLVPYGVVWSRILVIGVVVGYALVVGMSASIMRAAVMATLFGVSIIVTRRYQLLNALSCAAILLLCVDPAMIYDVAFQLSFVAVLAIGLWVVPLARALYRWSVERGWNKIGLLLFNSLFGSLILGVASTLATLPIVATTFGVVSLSGALLSPLVTLTTFVILLVSLLWVFVGFGFAAPLFGAILSSAVWLQDGAVAYMSSGWRDAVDLSFNGWWAVVIYLIYGLLTIIITSLYRNRGSERGGLN